MTAPAFSFLMTLALNYAFDFAHGRPYWHKLNVAGAAVAGFLTVAVIRLLGQ